MRGGQTFVAYKQPNFCLNAAVEAGVTSMEWSKQSECAVIPEAFLPTSAGGRGAISNFYCFTSKLGLSTARDQPSSCSFPLLAVRG